MRGGGEEEEGRRRGEKERRRGGDDQKIEEGRPRRGERGSRRDEGETVAHICNTFTLHTQSRSCCLSSH